MSRTPATARAEVLEGPRRLVSQTLVIPEIGENDGLLRVEACGLCRTDVDQFEGRIGPFPAIPGHEIVGTIAEIGPAAAERWGVKKDDRVAVEPRIVCHSCRNCSRGLPCATYPGLDRVYGYVPLTVEPGLWGGYADYLYLHPSTDMHKVPAGLSAEEAVLFNPLANGIEWSVTVPQPQFGDTVVVLGAGQRGLASVIALRARGVERVILTGLARDAHKLQLGAQLGATPVQVDAQDLMSVVADVSDGDMADVVVDTTPGTTSTIIDAVDIAGHGGQVVLCGIKSELLAGLDTYKVIMKDLTIRCGVAARHSSYAEAVRLIDRHPALVAPLLTHQLPLSEARRGIELLAGDGEAAISIALIP